jgi:alkylated DNA repair dioxygenase AlkB
MISNYLDIKGLRFVQNFLNEYKQRDILFNIDKLPWCLDLSRRTQHYGYKYDYRKRKIDTSMRADNLPDWAVNIGRKLVYCGLMSAMPDQMIINEYMPGQGIAQHVDCVPCFKDEIATVSLGSIYQMEMIYLYGKPEKKIIDLSLGSCLVFTGESRYNWSHGIVQKRADGDRPRGRRVSLTFRKVILNDI